MYFIFHLTSCVFASDLKKNAKKHIRRARAMLPAATFCSAGFSAYETKNAAPEIKISETAFSFSLFCFPYESALSALPGSSWPQPRCAFSEFFPDIDFNMLSPGSSRPQPRCAFSGFFPGIYFNLLSPDFPWPQPRCAFSRIPAAILL